MTVFDIEIARILERLGYPAPKYTDSPEDANYKVLMAIRAMAAEIDQLRSKVREH